MGSAPHASRDRRPGGWGGWGGVPDVVRGLGRAVRSWRHHNGPGAATPWGALPDGESELRSGSRSTLFILPCSFCLVHSARKVETVGGAIWDRDLGRRAPARGVLDRSAGWFQVVHLPTQMGPSDPGAQVGSAGAWRGRSAGCGWACRSVCGSAAAMPAKNERRGTVDVRWGRGNSGANRRVPSVSAGRVPSVYPGPGRVEPSMSGVGRVPSPAGPITSRGAE